MSVNIPTTQQDIDNKIKADIQRELPTSNPYGKNTFLGAIASAISLRQYDNYQYITETINNLFLLDPKSEFLDTIGNLYGVTRKTKTQSSGNVVFTGTSGTVIPISTALQNSAGIQYNTTSSGTITNTTLSVLSLTRLADTVTVTTVSDHNLSSFIDVTISGANETDYNGTFNINITGTNTFTYTITTTPTTPATGTIISNFTIANIPIQSVDFGTTANLSASESVTLTTPIASVDNTAYVDFNTVSGAIDDETDVAYQVRVKYKIQNPVSAFNVSNITNIALSVDNVTRVFVQPVTPDVGQVTIKFVNDNAASILPTGTDITNVKNAIIAEKPVNTSDADIFVQAPTTTNVNFIFSSITPNTTSMQEAIKTNLEELFASLDLNEVLTANKYNAIISTTIDRETGETLQNYTLTTPTTDIVSELPVLQGVSF